MEILNYLESDLFHGARFDVGLVENDWAFTLPISKATQTSGMPGARWRAQIGWDDNGLNDAIAHAGRRPLGPYRIVLRKWWDLRKSLRC
ncbi:hypothetical protein [Pigmentiphaga humi]|uniref:hypothetical protein n=1 Tax=Pigmentiphaga humi TaxID=2478468 RepID=UPI000F51DFAE|nr:hypothetical protein [Pigmentiphaga humi]